MAYMLHQISFSVINGKQKAGKMPRHFYLLYFVGKGCPGNSSQCLAHGVQRGIMMPVPITKGRLMTMPHGFVRSVP